MYGSTYGRSVADPPAETCPELLFVREMNRTHRWDCSPETVQLIHAHLTAEAGDEAVAQPRA